MNTTVLHAASGELRWGYHQAATLRDVVLQITPERTTISGVIVSKDDYRVSQHPLSFVLTPKGWRWPITQLQIAESGVLNATAGPQE